MDGERKIYLSEGVPLNSTGAANIFVNTGKSPNTNSPDGTVIHLKTEKPSDLGVHINTTFSIASSKKIKLLFVLNFLLSVICMVISCSMGFYYWNELISMRRQLDMMKEHFSVPPMSQDKLLPSALVGHPRLKSDSRESRMEGSFENQIPQNTKKYFVEDLGEDMLLVDLKKKNVTDKTTTLTVIQRDLVIAQFNGAIREYNMGTQSIIGPWARDQAVSTKNSDSVIELNANDFTVKEGGLYLIYAQVVYLSQAPNCYFIWALQTAEAPRLLSTCASGDLSPARPLKRSQMSCSTHTVARLYPNDKINIVQREPNRTLWLRPGYTYFGFIKLSS